MTSSTKKYLYEVQGLRTLAALLVAVYHIWFQRVSGGVDVFFVVAAFFLTLSLTKNGKVSFLDVSKYYMNTFRRVLPVTSVVIIASVVGVLMITPTVIWKSEIIHSLGSTFFVENWFLALKSNDYLSQGINSSVFQQMWAISIQMQMYLMIPILMCLLSLFSNLLRYDFKKILLIFFFLMFFISLNYSVYSTNDNQSFAYFDTFARLWEFAFGVLLALSLNRFFLSKFLLKFLGGVSLFILIGFAAVFDVSTQFPGYLALVPCIAASGVILSSYHGGYVPLLARKPFIYLADYSFAFYLWHWPVLCFYRQLADSNDVSALSGVIIIFISFLLSYVSTKFFELPIRNNSTLKSSNLKTLAVSSLIGTVVLIVVVGFYSIWKYESSNAYKKLTEFVELNYISNDHEVLPPPIIARNDKPESYVNGCHQNLYESKVISCNYGPETAEALVVLVGGSHSLQWLPALKILAEKYNFKLTSVTKSGCVLSLSDPGLNQTVKDIESCIEWNELALSEIINLSPDLIVTIGTRHVNGEELIPDGYWKAWQKLEMVGLPILALRDNPWFEFDLPYCVEKNKNAKICSIKKSDFYAEKNPLLEVDLNNFHTADLIDLYCFNDTCSGVIDDVLVYRDKHHLTKTFVVKNYSVLERVIQQTGLIF